MTSPDEQLLEPLPASVPSRVVIEGVEPEVDEGRFPAKRTLGEELVVAADVFCDGHEMLAVVLRFRRRGSEAWTEVPMAEQANDRWTARFALAALGTYEYTLEAWIDPFATWQRGCSRKLAAGQDVASDLLEGAALIRRAAEAAHRDDAEWLRRHAGTIAGAAPADVRAQAALDPVLAVVMARNADRSPGVRYHRTLEVIVDRERARYGAWYELFPRSTAATAGRHGTFRDVETRLPRIAAMGFDVLYLPPIHPIGHSFRKGPNNTLTAGPNDPGSPWAIGGPEGGHTAIHTQLGTIADFDHLLAAAEEHGIEIALDVAFQCSPDHPYVLEHPEWFRQRPDGSIKYAENPPKKYQDIYPLDFECADWQGLWRELRAVVLFWIGRGVRIFRVDNPHTKPFRFWEWLIGGIRRDYPEAIFLAEAFTRPKVMKHLAKSGFTQSYTYFTWRNAKQELISYFTELTQTAVRDVMRPNLFANTPDILPEFLQFGGPAAFRLRFLLAATLGATYGIYGPPFEECEHRPVAPGSEEYLDSEKYQVRHWDWDRPDVFREFIARVNRIRRESPALQHDRWLRFYPVDNDQLLFYGKTSPDGSNVLLVVANLDPHHRQGGFVHMPIKELGIAADEAYQVHDLITGGRFLWQGEANFVELDPGSAPAHIFRILKRVKTERDFDYFF